MRIPRMNKRLAAFGAGIALWEAIVHGSLFLGRQRPKLFGIRLTDKLNLAQSIVPVAVAILLGRYAFSIAMSQIRLTGEDFIGEVAT